jgi:F-type H+-transporting ATPase subunit delta
VGADLRAAVSALWGDERLRTFFLGERVPQEAKKRVTSDLVGERAHRLVRGFLQLVIDKRREAELPEMVRVYSALEDRAAGVTDVLVRTAVPLGKKDQEDLEAPLAAKLGRVRLSFETDPSLVGGVQLRTGGRVYDASLKRRLQKLGEHLAKARVGG